MQFFRGLLLKVSFIEQAFLDRYYVLQIKSDKTGRTPWEIKDLQYMVSVIGII